MKLQTLGSLWVVAVGLSLPAPATAQERAEATSGAGGAASARGDGIARAGGIVGTVNDVRGTAIDCAERASELAGAAQQAREWRKAGTLLKRFGQLADGSFALVEAGVRVSDGDADGAHQVLGDAAADLAFDAACSAFGPTGRALCTSYEVGHGIGQILNNAPKFVDPGNETLNNMWTDFLAEKLGPAYLEYEGGWQEYKKEFSDLASAYEARQQELDGRESRLMQANYQCRPGELAKSEIADVLALAKAAANQELLMSLPSDGNLAGQAALASSSASQQSQSVATSMIAQAGSQALMRQASGMAVAGSSDACSQSAAQIAAYRNAIAANAPNRNATQYHAATVASQEDGLASQQRWHDQNCR